MILSRKSSETNDDTRHDGRLYVRGLCDGVRLLVSLLNRGEITEAERLIERAERAGGRG